MQRQGTNVRCGQCNSILRVNHPQPSVVKCPICHAHLNMPGIQDDAFESLPPIPQPSPRQHLPARTSFSSPRSSLPRKKISFALVARILIAGIGLIVLLSPIGYGIYSARREAAGEVELDSVDKMTYLVWTAVLIGIPCLIIAIKGIRVDAQSMKVRQRGLVLVVTGIGMMLLGAAITFGMALIAQAMGAPVGIIATGLIIVGIGTAYIGIILAIMGIDIRDDFGRSSPFR